MTEKISFINGAFDVFNGGDRVLSKSIVKLRECLTGRDALNFDVFCEKIINSPESKGYFKQKEKLVEDFRKNNPDKNLKEIAVSEVPELIQLVNTKSDLELDKIEINLDNINRFKDPNKDINSNDFGFLKQYINFS